MSDEHRDELDKHAEEVRAILHTFSDLFRSVTSHLFVKDIRKENNHIEKNFKNTYKKFFKDIGVGFAESCYALTILELAISGKQEQDDEKSRELLMQAVSRCFRIADDMRAMASEYLKGDYEEVIQVLESQMRQMESEAPKPAKSLH